MKKELQEKLFKKYPKIFAQKDLQPDQTSMYRGIECPDEWYHIIDMLCEEIQTYVDIQHEKRQDRIYLTPVRDFPQVEAEQVKEKFGVLRFYVNIYDEYINGLIKMAENFSSKLSYDVPKE